LGGSASAPQPTGGPSLKSNLTAGHGEDKLRCPKGGIWQVWYDDFQTLDPANWQTEESTKNFITHGEEGMTMTISQAMVCSWTRSLVYR
jgi:hypothetical protein